MLAAIPRGGGTVSIQLAEAYEDESVMLPGPV